MELAEFVKARLDEDAAAANAGARRVGMPWRAEPQPGTPGGLVIDELGLVGSTGGRYAADHIARHDPARALREVAAKRKILWDHTPQERGRRAVCSRCHYGNVLGANWPCLTMTSLAGIWSDHPDFRAEWTP